MPSEKRLLHTLMEKVEGAAIGAQHAFSWGAQEAKLEAATVLLEDLKVFVEKHPSKEGDFQLQRMVNLIEKSRAKLYSYCRCGYVDHLEKGADNGTHTPTD